MRRGRGRRLAASCASELRSREIGIRLALGAAPGEVRDLLLRQGAVLAGLSLGLAGAWAGARTLSGLLHGVGTRDP